MNHVVQFSTGVGSAYAAHLVIDRHGPDVTLLFADVRRNGGEWWEGEDPDNYRFAEEIVAHLGVELVTVCDGRGVWGLAEQAHMIPNNRAPFCSRVLKHEPARRWIEANCDPADTTIHVGIDLFEDHRCDPIRSGWAPWQVEFPLIDHRPLATKADAFDWLASIGIDPPAMYAAGFAHANCAGACVRMGNAAAEHLYRVRPEVYAGLEAREEAMRAQLGKDVSILVDRRGLTPGEPRRPLPLAALRAEIEARDAAEPRLFAVTEMDCGRCWT